MKQIHAKRLGCVLGIAALAVCGGFGCSHSEDAGDSSKSGSASATASAGGAANNGAQVGGARASGAMSTRRMPPGFNAGATK